MKISFYAPFLALAGALSLQNAGAASYTVESNTVLVGSSGVNFDIAKFNSNLGTLTGVQVSVVESALGGTVRVSNLASVATTVSGFSSSYTVSGVTTGLGYLENTAVMNNVLASPDRSTTTIDPSSSVTFTISGGQSFVVASQNIAPSSFSTYSSVGGADLVTFKAVNAQTVTATGEDYSVNSGSAKTSTRFAITYTYTAAPVPEPSVAVLSAMALSGMALVRRREKLVSRL